MGPKRLQTDADYRRAQEDWLDLQENLGRSPDDIARTDLRFLAGTAILGVAAAVLLARRLFVRG
jgi:hypothetical protein